MRLFLLLTLSLTSCQTVADVPPCDPNKVYIQPVPPVCKKVSDCAKPVKKGLPYSKRDESHFESAKLRCVEHFPTRPCLKVFTKVGKNRYTAICGGKDNTGALEVLTIRGDK